MLYKFKSNATSDLIMLGPQGDQLLKLLGRSPAAQGIFEPETMPQAWGVLEQAVKDEESALRDAKPHNPSDPHAEEDPQDPTATAAVSLRQRVWPFIDMLKRAHAEQQAVVWGV